MTAPLAITPGEPAGIGPDLCVMLAQEASDIPWVAVADPALLQQRAAELQLPLAISDNPQAFAKRAPGTLNVVPVPLATPVTSGHLNPDNATYVLQCLDRAIDGCLQQEFAGLVTGPVHKGVINDAGIPFTGHTEYLAKRTHTDQVVMMLATEGLRVALATTHLPLKAVADAITTDHLRTIIRILHQDLQQRFHIGTPHILVCGLNPHAGEGGHLGDEEVRVIAPVLEQLRGEGMHLSGPLPADTLFNEKYLAHADAVLAMYHDQGLPVLKYKGFGRALNITLGLPMIRTSVDHGTALDLAGTGKVDTGSLKTALQTAWEMANGS